MIDQAALHSAEALALFRRLGDTANVALVLTNLGELALHQGDLSRAIALCEEGLALFREHGYRREIGATLETLAEAEIVRGNLDVAAGYLQEGLTLADEVDDREGAARALEELAALAAARAAAADGARLLAAAAALRDDIGAPLAAVYHPGHGRTLAALRDALAADDFARAWDEGRALDADAAIAVGIALSRSLLPTSAG